MPKACRDFSTAALLAFKFKPPTHGLRLWSDNSDICDSTIEAGNAGVLHKQQSRVAERAREAGQGVRFVTSFFCFFGQAKKVDTGKAYSFSLNLSTQFIIARNW